MSKTIRALRVHGWGETPVIGEITLPDPGPGESLVCIEAATVSHLDLTVLGGHFAIRPDLPYVGGVEGAGVILRSDRFAPGTRVGVRGAGLGLVRSGTWAEAAVVPDEALRLVPPELSPTLAAACYDPLTTGHVVLHDIARLGHWAPEEPETVAVTGAAGAVGSIAVQLARRAGARVIGLVSRPERAPLVPAGIETVCLSDEEATARLARDRGIGLLIDTIGGAGLAQRLGWVRPGGRAVVVGYTAGTESTLDLPNWLLGDVALLPANLLHREAQGRRVIDEMTDLLVRGELALGVETYPFSDVGTAFARLRAGDVHGRVVLVRDA